MSYEPISEELIARTSAIFPEKCRFLKKMEIDYSGSSSPIHARDLSNGALAKVELQPRIMYSGVFTGMRQSGVLTMPLNHLSGFHMQYMAPQFSFVGVAKMICDGKIQGLRANVNLDEIVKLESEGLLTDTDVREFRNAVVPITDDSVVYGTAWLLEPFRVHTTSGLGIAQVKYTFGLSLEHQPQVAHGRYVLALAPLLAR